LFEPDAGLTLSHVSELTTLQSVLEMILNVAVLLASALILNAAGLTDKAGAAPAWVMVTV
jgi:hypothetical protein